MKKLNCWEVKKCGRQPRGANVDQFGVCPAALATEFNGIHDGKNAGRFCWVVVGTLCKGKVQGSFANKSRNCMECNFFKQVRNEEADQFNLSKFDVKKRNYNKDKE